MGLFTDDASHIEVKAIFPDNNPLGGEYSLSLPPIYRFLLDAHPRPNLVFHQLLSPSSVIVPSNDLLTPRKSRRQRQTKSTHPQVPQPGHGQLYDRQRRRVLPRCRKELGSCQEHHGLEVQRPSAGRFQLFGAVQCALRVSARGRRGRYRIIDTETDLLLRRFRPKDIGLTVWANLQDVQKDTHRFVALNSTVSVVEPQGSWFDLQA